VTRPKSSIFFEMKFSIEKAKNMSEDSAMRAARRGDRRQSARDFLRTADEGGLAKETDNGDEKVMINTTSHHNHTT
jgi:hypothetical protein